MSPSPVTVFLAAPRGFCAGVDRAIEIVETALAHYGAPVYVRHHIVHNVHVVADLEAKGAIFVEDLDDVPSGSPVVFSAHGIPPHVREDAQARGLDHIDATCPLVTKVHASARRHAAADQTIILIGHAGHQEVIGTMGQAPDQMVLVETVEDVMALELDDPDNVAYITQTTLSVDETREVIAAICEKFPNVRKPKGQDICYATQNRQDATKVLAEQSDLVLVVGSAHSSNSNRMVEVARTYGAASHLIDDANGIDPAWLEGVDTVGLTSGASAPDALVQGVIKWLKARPRGAVVELLDVVEEDMHFALPSKLRSLPVANR
ncbi:4-hydroxy-3-methylbut-2-enyl diphosphate reductase [Stomatohabitans albus]|uniref:4-hydroxy-3-methylbut-2-enyl diphosphate reductase n=1 Tax=Stomatohabitans albus TaxID=3110766 RepID=UPI00300DAE63